MKFSFKNFFLLLSPSTKNTNIFRKKYWCLVICLYQYTLFNYSIHQHKTRHKNEQLVSNPHGFFYFYNSSTSLIPSTTSYFIRHISWYSPDTNTLVTIYFVQQFNAWQFAIDLCCLIIYFFITVGFYVLFFKYPET